MITVNMDKAREIHRQRIRQARFPKLAELDTAFQRELEKVKPNTAAIAAKKQALRDAPSDPAIAAAKSPEELKEAWPADILGPSPYTATATEAPNA